MAREEAVAGQFYEENREKLTIQIKDCFHHKLGPGALPLSTRKGSVYAFISPHAGYVFSGPCAVWGYKELAEAELSDLYILIGPNHYGYGSSVSIEDWKTPFGFLKTDKDFVRGIALNTVLPIDDSFHAHEHSVEVQLPFLYFINKDKVDKFKIACVTLSNDVDIDKLAKDLLSYLETLNKKITFIISSDFTHYGRNFRYLPFTLDVKQRLTKLDDGAIDLILEKNAKEFMDYVQKTGATICGFLPIYLLLKIIGDQKGEILRYYTSADITGDKKNSVSYASIIFK